MAFPRLYDPQTHPRMMFQIMLLGHTEQEAAAIIGVSHRAIDKWKQKYPEFTEQLQRGRDVADGKVVENFYMNCLDRYVEVEKVHTVKVRNEKGQVDLKVVRVTEQQFIQGDKWAQARWLALRQRENWSEVHRMEIKQTTMDISMNLKGLDEEELKVIQKIQQNHIQANTKQISTSENITDISEDDTDS